MSNDAWDTVSALGFLCFLLALCFLGYHYNSNKSNTNPVASDGVDPYADYYNLVEGLDSFCPDVSSRWVFTNEASNTLYIGCGDRSVGPFTLHIASI